MNSISIVTNGSRNAALYEKLAGIAKYINFLMNVSIHTDHVEMDHILELIEKLSHDVKMHFVLMFNPGKRDMVHEIYETMLDTRKRFPFSMNIVLIRDKGVDRRYTQEDFIWQKKASTEFAELARKFNFETSFKKTGSAPLHIFHEIEENGERKITMLAKIRKRLTEETGVDLGYGRNDTLYGSNFPYQQFLINSNEETRNYFKNYFANI